MIFEQLIEKYITVKNLLIVLFSAIGAAIARSFGGWTMALQTLIILMTIDYITGVVVAAVFKKSKKTKSGALSSAAGWQGLCIKVFTLSLVLIGYRLDLMFSVNYIKEWIAIIFSINECYSILENGGLMGIKYPAALTSSLDVLNKHLLESVETMLKKGGDK